MRGCGRINAIGRIEAVACQRIVGAQFTWHPGKKPSGAHVGKETDPAHARALRAQAAATGVPVVFTGGISAADLRTLYADAAVFCLPGEPHPHKVEGFGLVFLEAAAQGTPALASRVDAIPEVVLDGRTGVLVPPRDPAAYAAALAALLAEPARLQALGQAARLRARKFTWQRCAELTYGPP